MQARKPHLCRGPQRAILKLLQMLQLLKQTCRNLVVRVIAISMSRFFERSRTVTVRCRYITRLEVLVELISRSGELSSSANVFSFSAVFEFHDPNFVEPLLLRTHHAHV